MRPGEAAVGGEWFEHRVEEPCPREQRAIAAILDIDAGQRRRDVERTILPAGGCRDDRVPQMQPPGHLEVRRGAARRAIVRYRDAPDGNRKSEPGALITFCEHPACAA